MASGALLILALAGCTRQPADRVTPLAVLPANVLLSEGSADWMRLAVPLVLEQDLRTSPRLSVSAAGNESSVYAAGSSAVLRTTIDGSAGAIAVQASLFDLASQHREKYVETRNSRDNLIAALDSAAHKLDGNASPFSTQNEKALEAFVRGFFSQDAREKVRLLEAAIHADPNFGLAYVGLAETLAGAKDPRVKEVLARGTKQSTNFQPADRARFDLVRARVENAPVASRITAAEALVKLAPNDSEALAVLGADLFLEGRAAEGERALGRAVSLRPQSLPLRQQLATGLVANRRYQDAAKVLASLNGTPAGGPQLAACLLLAGDKQQADRVFEGWTRAIGSADAQLLLRATWQALSGRRAQGVQQIEQGHFEDPRASAVARGQAVIWALLNHDRETAQRLGADGGELGQLFAAGAPTPDEWRTRVEALPSAAANEDLKRTLLRYGYFLLGFYKDSADAWRAADREASGSDLRARAMLAASLDLAGQRSEAQQIRVEPFLPDLNDSFSAVSFGELRRMLGQAE